MNTDVVQQQGAPWPRCFMCNRPVCRTPALCARGFARWLAGRPVLAVLRLVGALSPAPAADATLQGVPRRRRRCRRWLRPGRLLRRVHQIILPAASDIASRPGAP